MPFSVLEIPNTPSRILSKKQAAAYCRIPINKFPYTCPVTPLDMGNNVTAYDIKDLEQLPKSVKRFSDEKRDKNKEIEQFVEA